MIEQTDELLANWIETILGEGLVSHEAPDNTPNRARVHLYLLDLVDSPPPRGGAGRPPLQFSLRYLVTTPLGQPEEAHRLLGQLAFAAMENPEFEVEFQGLPAATWSAMGAIPRPCFLIKMPVRKERPEPAPKPVLHPLVVEVSGITSLHGLVVGPGRRPWVGARVELPSLQLATRTNTKGQFRFPTVPRAPETKLLRINAKGRVFDIPVQQPAEQGETVEVQLDPSGNNSNGSERQEATRP